MLIHGEINRFVEVSCRVVQEVAQRGLASFIDCKLEPPRVIPYMPVDGLPSILYRRNGMFIAERNKQEESMIAVNIGTYEQDPIDHFDGIAYTTLHEVGHYYRHQFIRPDFKLRSVSGLIQEGLSDIFAEDRFGELPKGRNYRSTRTESARDRNDFPTFTQQIKESHSVELISFLSTTTFYKLGRHIVSRACESGSITIDEAMQLPDDKILELAVT